MKNATNIWALGAGSPVLWVLILVLMAVVVGGLQAQTPTDLVINYPQVTERPEADYLGLDVFFTLVDGNRAAVVNPNIDSATVQIVGDSVVYETAVSQPNTPFFVAIVLDTSGSMDGAIEDMRQAASQAIDGAPPEAQFAVIRFNEDINLVRDFSADHARVQDAINSVQVANKGTCLYDATYTAIDLVNQATNNLPQARRAVIVFTDGRDELIAGQSQPCSRHTYREVVDFATVRNANVPIHTIGLSGGQNINVNELRSLAAETGGLAAIGDQAELADSFQQIIDGLRSQWVASARLYPPQGDHDATLTVRLRDGQSLTENFKFTSSRDYFQPPEPVSVSLDSLRLNEAGNYLLSLDLVSPEQVGQVEVLVLDNGVEVARFTAVAPDPSVAIEILTADLTIGKQYNLEIRLRDAAGALIRDERGEPLLLDRSFRYDLEVEDDVLTSVTIGPVRADEANGVLLLGVRTENGDMIAAYEISLVHEQSRIEVYNQPGAMPDESGMLTIPLENIGDGSYTVILQAYDGAGSVVATAEYSDIEYTPPPPPPPPGALARITAALLEFWYISAMIVLIVLGVIFWFMFRSRQEKLVTGTPFLQNRGIQSAGGGDVLHNTMMFDQLSTAEKESVKPASRSRSQRAPRLKIIQTIDGSLVGREVELTRFPFVIGREGCDLNILGDGRVSRRHVSITVENGRYHIIDLKSSNGTYINGQRLQANTPVPLTESIRLELGKFTTLEVTV